MRIGPHIMVDFLPRLRYNVYIIALCGERCGCACGRTEIRMMREVDEKRINAFDNEGGGFRYNYSWYPTNPHGFRVTLVGSRDSLWYVMELAFCFNEGEDVDA